MNRLAESNPCSRRTTGFRRFRRLNRAWARAAGYFWLPCPICGEMFGGHEAGSRSVPVAYMGGPGEDGDVTQLGLYRKIACWRHG